MSVVRRKASSALVRTLCQAEQAVKKTEVYLSAGGTEAVLVRPDSMPAEATDLVSTGAGEEVDVIDLERLHTQRALHQVVLHPRVPGHPTITHTLLDQATSRTGTGAALGQR